MPNNETIQLKIKRQENPLTQPYWEEFVIPYKPGLNVISCLMEIQRNPVNSLGEQTKPVIWDCNCLEEVCGACTMIINRAPRMACSTLIKNLKQPIVLEPLKKFPVIRDLMVNRKVMFENLRKVKSWINIDGTHNIGPGPRVSEKTRTWAYELSRCMTCGCCMEACPQVNSKSEFIGPATIAQVRLMNAHPTGVFNAEERLESLMGPGGASECGNAQNCERVCPKGLPLLDSIGDINRQIIKHGVLGWLKK